MHIKEKKDCKVSYVCPRLLNAVRKTVVRGILYHKLTYVDRLLFKDFLLYDIDPNTIWEPFGMNVTVATF